MKVFLVFLGLFYSIHADYYEAFTKKRLSEEEMQRYVAAQTTTYCTIDIKPCNITEGRRLDGSCNSLDNPPSASLNNPYTRVLPAVYSGVDDPRKSVSNEELPLPRLLSTKLLLSGQATGLTTQLFLNFVAIVVGDLGSIHDTLNYLGQNTHCCSEEGKTDRECIPSLVPDDDPVLRFSNIRCLNLTRPKTYQSVGCIPNNTTPARIKPTSPYNNLEFIYGNSETTLSEYRTTQGLLKYEMLNGRMWPPSSVSNGSTCASNQLPTETRCHNTPASTAVNSLISVNVLTVLLWRFHNYCALELYKVNPCWSDQKLFETARDITIASVLQIYYYGLWPILLGKENLIKEGIISLDPGFRNIHDASIEMEVTIEYQYLFRWFHKLLTGTVKLYDKNGYVTKEMPVGNLTCRTGYLALDDNFEQIVRGSVIQPSAAPDYVADPMMSSVALGPLQVVLDVFTNDMSKGRHFGIAPYVDYAKLHGHSINCWEDLNSLIDPERLKVLREAYEDVRDIDFMAGLWLEKHVKGGMVPYTASKIIIEQLKRTTVSDRHWYESSERPNAFTCDQLSEIRKLNISTFMCFVGDGITEIQRNAFFIPGPDNEVVQCEEMNTMDFSKWADPTCSA